MFEEESKGNVNKKTTEGNEYLYVLVYVCVQLCLRILKVLKSAFKFGDKLS